MIEVDGSRGEGGGQILRTSLSLSTVTGRPFRITRIRAGRKKPGLMRQHLTAVRAAAEVARAEVRGVSLGSPELTFAPGEVRAGEFVFDVGTAGSTTLVLQTALPALLRAGSPSTLVLRGGTHNPHAPPFEFLDRTFLPAVRLTGARLSAELVRPGFFPAGGGELRVSVEPPDDPARVDMLERGRVRRRRARATVARLPRDIAEREVRAVRRALGWSREETSVEEIADSDGPGNVVTIEIECEHVTEVLTGFGRRGVRAEVVAERVAEEARRYVDSGVPVGEHLADQLLVPLAVGRGGSYRTLEPSSHSRTNAEVIEAFLGIRVRMDPVPAGGWLVRVDR